MDSLNENTPLLSNSNRRRPTRRYNYAEILFLLFLLSASIVGMCTGFYLLFTEDKQWHSYGSFNLISRKMWHAHEPHSLIPKLQLPVSEVLLLQTNSTNCNNAPECTGFMLQLQSEQMLHASDILYNFVFGGDGDIYEGRGWHSRIEYHRNNSLIVAFSGNFNESHPNVQQIEAAKGFFDVAVKTKLLLTCFKLVVPLPYNRYVGDVFQYLREATNDNCL